MDKNSLAKSNQHSVKKRQDIAQLPTVLVIDESPAVRKIVQKTLQHERIRVITAGDGLSALTSVADVMPDLILIDTNLPGIDGYHICRIIRKNMRFQSTPIIMLSGRDGSFDKAQARLAGSTEYLTKPFTTKVLVQTVKKHLVDWQQRIPSQMTPLEEELQQDLSNIIIRSQHTVAQLRQALTPVQHLLRLIDTLSQCINGLLIHHGTYAISLHGRGQRTDAETVLYLEQRFGQPFQLLAKQQYPILEMATFTNGQLDCTEIIHLYMLVKGEKLEKFYRETVLGLAAFLRFVFATVLHDEVDDLHTSRQLNSLWRAFLTEIDQENSFLKKVETISIKTEELVKEPEKSLLAIHPDFIQILCSFLEKAAIDKTDVNTLMMFYLWATDPIRIHAGEVTGKDYIQFMNVDTWMMELVNLFKGQIDQHKRYDLLGKLYNELDKINKTYDIISDANMRKLGEAIQEVQPTAIPPYMRLHQAIEKAGAYQFLNPERQKLLQTYLTTDQTFTDIQKSEGFKSATGVAGNIKKSLEILFPHLPQEIQQEFKSPKEAVRTKAAHHTESSRRHLREGLDRLGRTDIDKIEFSDTHKQNIANAASQRWQRQREAQRSTGQQDQP